MIKNLFVFYLFCTSTIFADSNLYLRYWQDYSYTNFGDYLSVVIVEKMVNQPVLLYKTGKTKGVRKLLALGSILTLADDHDVVWGSGIKGGGHLALSKYRFTQLDVRATRGPLTRAFLQKNFGIECPEVYGDPALLLPYLFPEFKPSENPTYDYIIIPHYGELSLFPKEQFPNVVSPLEPWEVVVKKILDSKFVIASSLHGIIVAEAFGIPARLLRVTPKQAFLKYKDYYLGTGRPDFKVARSIEEALTMGGESPIIFDPKKLYDAFPFEYWGINQHNYEFFNK